MIPNPYFQSPQGDSRKDRQHNKISIQVHENDYSHSINIVSKYQLTPYGFVIYTIKKFKRNSTYTPTPTYTGCTEVMYTRVLTPSY